jgi:hypothetical protein
MDVHPGVAAWAQAVGTVLAVLSGFAVLFIQNSIARRADRRNQGKFHTWAVNHSALVVRAIRIWMVQLVLIEKQREGGKDFSGTDFGAPFLSAARDQISNAPPERFENPQAAHLFMTLGTIIEMVLKETQLAAATVSHGHSIGRYVASIHNALSQAEEINSKLCEKIGHFERYEPQPDDPYAEFFPRRADEEAPSAH